MNRILLVIITILTLSSCNLQKEFYESGNLKAKGKVTDNEKNGRWKIFYENGKIHQIGAYLNGKKTGEWKIFHENGQLRQIGEYKDDKQTGEWKFFHANSNREGIVTLVNGKRNGTWKWYHTNGKIYTERKWNYGKLINIISCFDGQGNKLNKGTLKNGNGTLNSYDIHGNLTETLTYKNGEYVK